METIFIQFANIIFNLFNLFGIHINTVDGANKMVFVVIVLIAGVVFHGVLKDIKIIAKH